jgi:hypothetical protein
VVLDQLDALADLAEVEARRSRRFLPLVRGLEPHARLLRAQQGDGLGDHVPPPQVDESRPAEGGAYQAGGRLGLVRVQGRKVGGDLVHRLPHDPSGEDAVGRAPGCDRCPEVVGVAESAVRLDGDAPAGGEFPLALTAEPGLRMTRDPRGIQQPA